MKTFRELHVWQKAHAFVLMIYRFTQDFPSEERYGLIAQMRRATVSIAANITEGHQRKSKSEFRQFLNIAHASLEEVKYYLLLAHDLDYLPNAQWQHCVALADEIGKMLNGLRTHIQGELQHV